MKKPTWRRRRRRRSCSLPVEVTVEILSRLPVKSLLRLRCVSKEWLNLISLSSSNPGSVKHLHKKRHFLLVWNDRYLDKNDYGGCIENNQIGAMMPSDDDDVRNIRVSVVDYMVDERVHKKMEIHIPEIVLYQVSCCRDLICFVGEQLLYVCNPSTQELVQLPGPDNGNAVAFGYLPSTNEYKLVSWFNLQVAHDYDMGCEIFSLTDHHHDCTRRADSGSWKRSVIGNDPRAVCVNGVIYWLLSSRPSQINSNMFSFDLETEESKLIPYPKLLFCCCSDDDYLLELKGFLCLVQQGQSKINIWILKNPDWIMEYTINLDPLPSICGSNNIVLIAYHISSAEELVFLSQLQGVLYYNIDKRSFRRSENLRHLTMRGYHEYPCHYFDSFFSLGTI